MRLASLSLDSSIYACMASLLSQVLLAAAFVLMSASTSYAQAATASQSPLDSVSIRLVDADLRSALTSLVRYLPRPTIIPQLVSNPRITLDAPTAVPRTAVRGLLQSLLSANGLELLEDTVGGVFRVRESSRPSQPMGFPLASPPQVPQVQRLWVVPVRYARASRVAQLLNSLLGRGTAVGEPGDLASTLSGSLREQLVPPQQMGDGISPRPVDPLRPLGNGQLTQGTVIVADDGTNVLLIRGSEADRDQVSAALRALDVRPLQVLIEVLIAEVRRDRSTSLGLELAFSEQPLQGTSGLSIAGTQSGASLGDFVVRVMKQGPYDASAILRAAQSRGNARIVSRPVIIAVNNEQAEILVGSQRPFVQVQRSLPTEAPSRDQVVQYRDVGTRLSVRPTISNDGFIALQITQEVNAATSETQFDAPVISTRNLQTRLFVRDSQTIVLGGLTDSQSESLRGGTPLLSRLPFIGFLFGRSNSRKAETEFFLFLTPRVLRDEDAVDRITKPRLRENP